MCIEHPRGQAPRRERYRSLAAEGHVRIGLNIWGRLPLKLILSPPNFVVLRKICFKHMIKTKSPPPKKVFCQPQTLKPGYGPGSAEIVSAIRMLCFEGHSASRCRTHERGVQPGRRTGAHKNLRGPWTSNIKTEIGNYSKPRLIRIRLIRIFTNTGQNCWYEWFLTFFFINVFGLSGFVNPDLRQYRIKSTLLTSRNPDFCH